MERTSTTSEHLSNSQLILCLRKKKDVEEAPKLGEDSTEVLKSIGYDDATIKEYIEKGIVVEKK